MSRAGKKRTFHFKNQLRLSVETCDCWARDGTKKTSNGLLAQHDKIQRNATRREKPGGEGSIVTLDEWGTQKHVMQEELADRRWRKAGLKKTPDGEAISKQCLGSLINCLQKVKAGDRLGGEEEAWSGVQEFRAGLIRGRTGIRVGGRERAM